MIDVYEDITNTTGKELDIISKENSSYLQLFEADLQGLAPKTIKHHLQNIDFFLNTYLLFDEAHPLSMQDGVNSIDDFIGYFLEEKTCFADSSKRSFVTSLRKFYKSMAAHGKITPKQYEDVVESLRDGGAEYKELLEELYEQRVGFFMCTFYKDVILAI